MNFNLTPTLKSQKMLIKSKTIKPYDITNGKLNKKLDCERSKKSTSKLDDKSNRKFIEKVEIKTD